MFGQDAVPLAASGARAGAPGRQAQDARQTVGRPLAVQMRPLRLVARRATERVTPARRTPPERSGTALCPRDARGLLLPLDPLARFAEKCRFDPTTGCVIWTGARTRGRGNTTEYGSFWYDGRRWFAHRFAAVFIHGLDVGKDEVGHCCPGGPNSLCVQHVETTTKAANIAERNTRIASARRAEQANTTRQFWLLVDRGYETPPETRLAEPIDIPFYGPPEWLRPYLKVVEFGDDCPF